MHFLKAYVDPQVLHNWNKMKELRLLELLNSQVDQNVLEREI